MCPNTSPKSATEHTHTHHKHKTRNPHTTPVPDPIPGTDPLIFSLFTSFPTHSCVPAWTQGHSGPHRRTRDRRPHDDPRGQHTFNDDHHDIRRGHPGTMLARHPGAGAGDTRRQWTNSRPMSLVHTTNTTSHEDPRGTSGATIDTHRPDDRRAHPGRTLARYHGAGAGATYRH